MFLLRLLPPLPREISLGVVGLCAGLFLAVMGALHGYGEVTGVAGTVRIANCDHAHGGWRDLWTDGWACQGAFEADDHSVSIRSVAVDGVFDDLPDATVAARVEGPSAHTALQDTSGSWKWPALTGVVILAFTAWRVRTIRRLLAERRTSVPPSAVPA
ncbi:hypothetical protein GCM10010503_08980 [Streptomyces lucensis JCM 4490]|uniref:Uncharacterized protein n=2 Tax=Streptomyces lucensis TaxID=67319 RepID=A0A918IXI2_9ACTN|nr:hypothetical protein GCM10010503_08980 [Streptomyces lucensis JCM 4490]